MLPYVRGTPQNSSPKLGEPTNAARAEAKFTLIMPCKEEEDEVKVVEDRRGMKKGACKKNY